MELGRSMIGIGRLALALGFGLLPALTACAGKSERNGSEDGNGGKGGGKSGSGSGGTSGRGGSSARGGTDSTTGGTDGGTTSNGIVRRIVQQNVDKIDLLFMIDNSISMADKQRILAEAVPVLVSRLIDPICIDADGNAAEGSASSGCGGASQPEFTPIDDIHIGIITSSLGNHGGDVCVPDPSENPPRTLNDAAQLIGSVRTGLYSYQNQGFLVWDPRTGSDRPVPDPHPGVSNHEQSVADFVSDFTTQIIAAGERGCGYEASLEAWYRFLVDPEPVNQVTVDVNGQFNLRGPINQLVLQQRASFMRPDSLLAIVMLTDENDCSINDENNSQGWLVGRRTMMPRGSDACAHPEDPDVYKCCVPCVLLDVPDVQPEGCTYGNDISCNTPAANGGHYLTALEDSTNLRCFDQVRRFGLSLLYPWQRYTNALVAPRISLRAPDATGNSEVPNPIYTPGVDGTPARDPSRVFLVGIVGVPWQDLADEGSLEGRGLRYLTASEMTATSPNRWDVILGDPDIGRQPTDPFMIESIDPRSGTNPIVNAAIAPPTATGQANPINGHEQNIVNRDDLQFACTFDLVPDVACTMANQDGCSCNASEQAYNRSICQYPSSGADGTQTHAKAYPGIRELQVLKGFGENSIVASICPKNVTPSGNAVTDPDYGYNPAVGAMIERFRQRLGPQCLPRPLTADDSGQVACQVVEAKLPESSGCSCDPSTGRADVSEDSLTWDFVQGALVENALCGGGTGVSCDAYCLCEIQQFSGADLNACQNVPSDPGGRYGFCYVDPDSGQGDPALVSSCPATQRHLIRFMGDGVPAANSAAFIVCPGSVL